MHDQCPVAWSDRYGGFWAVTRYEDVRAAEHDWDTFSVAPSMILPTFGTDRPLVPLDIDPPAHTPYRQILLPFFSPARMDELIKQARERDRQISQANPDADQEQARDSGEDA